MPTRSNREGRDHVSEGTITEGKILTGVMFNEPMRVVTTRQLGDEAMKVIRV